MGLSLSASPSSGPIPLVVHFTAVVIGASNTTQYDWTFGAGPTLAGAGPLYAAPVHVYNASGAYPVVVNVTDGGGPPLLCTTTVLAEPAPLGVTVLATNVTGAAPLHVSLIATPVGGSGSYLAPVWSMAGLAAGDGTVLNYTFTTPGTFVVTVEVTDTTGSDAEDNTTVRVSPSPTVGPDQDGEWLPVGSVLVGIGAGIGVGYLVAVRRRDRPAPWDDSVAARPPPPTGRGPPEDAPPTGIESDGVASPRSASISRSDRAVGPSGNGLPNSPGGMVLPAGSRPRKFVLSPAVVRTSERILLRLRETSGGHLEGRAPRALTQAGLQEALGLPQGAIASALGRMVRAGLVSSRLDHVPGEPRRVKVYRLTSRGEQVAREVRSAPNRPRGP
jgi:PKD repeat protein